MLLKYVRYSFLLLLAAWTVFNLTQTVQYIMADYSQIPVMDYWREPQLWANAQTIHWANLWVQHNEHRILFPELAYILDMFLFHGRMYLPIALSGACYAGVWCVLAWAAYSRKAIGSPEREAALLLAAVVLSWKGCSAVIATPFQLAFTLTELAVPLSLAFLAMACATGKLKHLVAAICSAIIATYSVGNGMLVWPVLIGAGLFIRLKRSNLVVLLAAAAGFVGLYFVGYHPLPSLIRTNISHPLQGLAFLFSYFSMPFGGYGPRTFGFEAGAANLAGMSLCFAIAWRRGLVQSRLGTVVFGSYLFILLSALLTTAGRMDLNDNMFVQAKAWRYVTLPTISWALLALALVWIVGEIRSSKWPLAVALSLAVWFFQGFRNDEEWVEGTRLDSANAQITATMLRNGVFDPNQVKTVFPDAGFVRAFSQVMRESHKSIYAHGTDKWIGGNLLTLPVQKAPVPGKITRVYPVPGGVEILGWAETSSLTDDHDILFVNEQNRIVGFGRRPAAGMPSNLGTWDTPNSLAFVGYISLAKPLDKIWAYALTFHGKIVSPLDRPIVLPLFTQQDSRSDAPVLPGINWVADENWAIGGYPIDPDNGPAPQQPIYGSHSGSDEKTGSVRTMPFDTPPNHCLVLPVLPGKASYGQSLEVRDADSSRVIAEIPFLDGRAVWARWRIPIPASTHRLTIAADDEGTGPNQWLALATPEECP